MKHVRGQSLIAAMVCALTLGPSLAAAQSKAPAGPPTPGFNTHIPDQIRTPNKVQTRAGTFDFVDGVPTLETTQKLYDNLDYLRGVEVFLNFIPASNLEGLGSAPSKPAPAKSTRPFSSRN